MECSVIFQHTYLRCLLIRCGSQLNMLFQTFIMPLWRGCWNFLSPRHLGLLSAGLSSPTDALLCHRILNFSSYPMNAPYLPPPVFSCPTASSQLCYLPFYSVQLDLLVSTNKQAYARLVFRIPSDFITLFISILAVTVIGVRLLLFMPGSYYTMHHRSVYCVFI